MKMAETTNFSKADVERWNRSRGRVITTTNVRGSHIDIYVKLYRWAGCLWPILIVAAALLSAVTLYKIIAPIASGRVEQIILSGGR